MATLAQISALTTDAALLLRLQAAILKAANFILIEDPATVNHQARHEAATQLMLDHGRVVEIARHMIHQVALNATIAAAEVQTPGSSADADIEFVVASVWDQYAPRVSRT